MTILEIPSGVKYVSPYACMASNLTKIVLPSSCETVSHQAFEDSSKLKEFVINGNPHIVSTALRGFKQCTFTVNNSTRYKVVNNCLIQDETNLLSVGQRMDTIIVPDGIIKIDISALLGSDVKTLIVPSSLRRVESYSFLTYLNEIKYQGNQQQFEKIVVQHYNDNDTTFAKWNAAIKTYNYSY